MPPLEFSHSQPVDQVAAQHLTSTPMDCSFAREVQTQVSASMAQPMPGAESLMAGGMPPVPGAEQAISPLVQMIMRMPGHIGLASSFFEALGNFFLPQTDMLNLFDPSHFGLHIDLSSALPGDHSTIDFSLLPHDAPLLDHLGNGSLSDGHSLDLASDKLNLSLGGQSHFAGNGESTSLSMGSQLNVSGQASFAKPQFEGAGGLVSGPSISESVSGNSMASNNRLFSDGESIASASKNMIAGGGPAGGMVASPALSPSASVSSLSSNSLAASGASTSALSDNVSAHASSANNVSYNVFEKLAGNKEILAANNVGDSYHSTVGSFQPDGGDTVSNAGAGHGSATPGSDNPGGLTAKPMSLDGSKVEFKADHAKLDGTDSSGKALDHKVEHKIDHKVEHKVEHKVADSAKSDKASEQTSHQTVKTASQTAHQPAHTQAAKVNPSANADSNQVAATAKHVAVEPKHVAVEPKHVTLEPKHVALEPKHVVAPEAKHIVAPTGHAVGTMDSQAQAPVIHDQIAQAHNTPVSRGQTEVAQQAAGADAQSQFGEPIKSGQGGDAATGGDATQAQDVNGQTLEQQGAPASASAQPTTYTIRSGDCLWNIAKDHLGDATKWSDIYKMNGDVLGANPSLIRPGVSIQLPGVDGAAAGNIAHYTVKPGDNLWDIAKNQMGDATKWGDLYKGNQDIIGSNPSLIRPGQELTINTGAADPSGGQLSSTGTGAAANVAQAPSAAGAAPAPAHSDLTTVSQNNQTINTYGDTEGAAIQTSPVQHSSEMNFEAAPVSHNIQAPAAVPVKVMPVEAQPDVIIQPAHAAELTSTAGLSPEAANVANGLAQSHKGGMVDTNVASDLMTFLNKRR